jgi:LAS superfamily LD-carboxypeptidase LdcB
MAAAYKAELKEKLTCSAIRSFEQQLKNRRKSVPVSGGGIGGTTCKKVNSRGCDTAIPGNSNHGIGQAIDIRPYYKRRHYAVNPYAGNGWAINSQSIQFKWMMKHAYKVGFLGIKWAHLGQDGTMLSSQKYEPWHWEPITGRVIG